MKLHAYISGIFSCWLDRHCKWYHDKLNREADAYFAVEQAVADEDTNRDNVHDSAKDA